MDPNVGETQTALAQFTSPEAALMGYAGHDSDVAEDLDLPLTNIDALDLPAAGSDAGRVRLLPFHSAVHMDERPAVIEKIRDSASIAGDSRTIPFFFKSVDARGRGLAARGRARGAQRSDEEKTAADSHDLGCA